MDEYVRNGGDLNKYFNITKNNLDVENIDVYETDNQKTIIKEFLSRKGFSDNQITKKIER